MSPIRTAILSTPRSGTHFLQSILDKRVDTSAYGQLNLVYSKYAPKETKGDLVTIIQDSITDKMKKNKMIVFIWNTDCEQAKFAKPPTQIFDKTILLQRKNKLHQYISLKIAQKTDNWAGRPSKGRIVLSVNDFKNYLQNTEFICKEQRRCVKDYIEIFYEDLCSTDKFKDVMEKIDDFIGVTKVDYSKLEDTRRSLFIRKQQVKPISEVIINYQDFEEYDKDIIF